MQHTVNHDLCLNYLVFWVADTLSPRKRWSSKYARSMWSASYLANVDNLGWSNDILRLFNNCLEKIISVENGDAHTNNDYAVFKASNICDIRIGTCKCVFHLSIRMFSQNSIMHRLKYDIHKHRIRLKKMWHPKVYIIYIYVYLDHLLAWEWTLFAF